MSHHILLVDDDTSVLHALRRSLSMPRGTYAVDIADSPLGALRLAEGCDYDLVIADYRMPEMDGVQFLRAFREIQPDAVRLILSGYADLDAVLEAINEAGISRFLSKPWNDYELRATINQALAQHDLLLENQRLADEVRAQRRRLTPMEEELRRLEALSPGITRVRWGEDGSVLLEPGD